MAPAFESWTIQLHSLYSYQQGSREKEDWPQAKRLSGSRGLRETSISLLRLLFPGSCFHQAELSAWLHHREEQSFSRPMLESHAGKGGAVERVALENPARPKAEQCRAAVCFDQMFAFEKQHEIQVHWCGSHGPSKELVTSSDMSLSTPHVLLLIFRSTSNAHLQEVLSDSLRQLTTPSLCFHNPLLLPLFFYFPYCIYINFSF